MNPLRLISLFRRKSTKDHLEGDPYPLTSEWKEAFPHPDGFPRPDWQSIKVWIGRTFGNDLGRCDQAAREFILRWLEDFQAALGDDYHLYDADDIVLLTQDTRTEALALIKECSRIRSDITDLHPDLIVLRKELPVVIISFEDRGVFWKYASHHHSPGSYGRAGAMTIRTGFPHIILPACSELISGQMLAHEISHLLRQAGIPLWIDEGLAIRAEGLSSEVRYRFDHGSIHGNSGWRWSREDINHFWSGRSFQMPGEIQPASYALASALLDSMMTEYSRFLEFHHAAELLDAGARAAREHLMISLTELVSSLLGPGDWEPDTELIAGDLGWEKVEEGAAEEGLAEDCLLDEPDESRSKYAES